MWTKEQEDALKAAKTRHNLCIFGKSGCGKSTIIKEIYKTFTQIGRVCKIVCPSGVACKVYDELAATVHSFYGLQTAELSAPLVMQRSLERNDVVNQIKSVDVLIWDEISMSSLRIFQIVNLLHQKVRNNSLPFGGIQVILGGDFCQLKPIQSVLDSGDPIYKSVLFDKVFPHRVVLEKIMRQSEFEGNFKKALDSLRMGVCDDDTEAYLRGLSRRCDDLGNNVPPPIHIFFKKLPVEVHNSYMLSCLSGEMLKYESIDTGRTGLLKNTVPKVLMLKRGCKVMLLFNISKSLTNGTLGTFIDTDQTDSSNKSLLIKFPNVGVVSIPRKTWYAYSKNGQIQASRTQFPLSLSYAITVHKAQSATLESAVVHCSQEFDAGQTYVALSRVRSEEKLQVFGFQKRFLLKQPAHIEQIHSAQHGNPVSSFTCCRNKALETANCELDREEDLSLINDENSFLVDKDLTCHEELISKYFASNQGVKQNFNQILQLMTNAEEDQEPQHPPLTQPPHDFVVKDFLETLTQDENSDALSQSVKDAAQYGIEHLEIFELLTRVLWCRVYNLFEGYLSENTEKVHMSAANFTQVTGKLNDLFLTNEYRSDVLTAFNLRNWSELNCGQRTLGAQLLFHLYQMCVSEISKSVSLNAEEESRTLKVSDMGPDGRGKIRYLGGWATHKLLEKSRRYVVENRYSTSREVLDKVIREMKKITLLEDNVIVSSQFMQETSEVPETLQVTESRQYRERGLLNISDMAYDFFMLLEQHRNDHINFNRLAQLGSDLIENSVALVTKNEVVQNKFVSLFCLDNAEEKVLALELYHDVVLRYMRMGVGQFLRDFRKDYQLKKSLAHQKAVLQKNEKANEKKMKVHMPQIEQDKSRNKQLSHLRLRALVDNVKAEGLKAMYSKKELQQLCDAYDVKFLPRWNKTKLASDLAQAVTGHESMPSPHVLLRFRAVLVEKEGNRLPVLRITRL